MRPITASRAETFAIGELSRLTGVNIETIRYYERIKMLPAPARTASGRRVYSAMEFRILVFIRRSRELGFSPDQIPLCSAWERPERPPAAKSRTSPGIISKRFGRSSRI